MLRKSPWLAAILCFFFWAINNVALKFITTSDISFTIFTCQTMLFSAITLLALSKPGPLGLQTFKTIATWGFGISFILEQIVLLALMKHISATEAIFLGKINIITSLLFAWAFKKRRPYAMSLLGLIPLLGGLWLFAGNIPPQFMVYTLAMLVLYAILLSAEILFIEVHETNNLTTNFADDARVTAFVIGITSIVLLIVVGLLTALEPLTGSNFGELTPTPAQALNPQSLLYAGLLGVCIASTTRYLEFVSVRQIKSEHFLALSALSPIFTYLLERLFGFNTIHLDGNTSLAAIAILGGSFAILATRAKTTKPFTAQEKALLIQAQQHGRTALLHYKNDHHAAAKALQIPPKTLHDILAGRKIYSQSLYKKLSEKVKQNILSGDSLTSLPNRLNFTTALHHHLSEAKPATICLLDLNKFKPVNDIHGHAAGDKVLQQVAQRLKSTYGKQAIITRLGGDEFCLMFYKPQKNTATITSSLQKLIAQPIAIQQSDEPVQVTASIGFAHAPTDGTTPDELLEAADRAMYKNKRTR